MTSQLNLSKTVRFQFSTYLQLTDNLVMRGCVKTVIKNVKV